MERHVWRHIPCKWRNFRIQCIIWRRSFKNRNICFFRLLWILLDFFIIKLDQCNEPQPVFGYANSEPIEPKHFKWLQRSMYNELIGYCGLTEWLIIKTVNSEIFNECQCASSQFLPVLMSTSRGIDIFRALH